MHRRRGPTGNATQRRGVTLLLVIALLTLFASVALGFVFYAESAAEAARLAREAVEPPGPDADPELLLAYFLNQLVYDTRDDVPGIYSALRGHGLLRSQWGADYAFNADGTLALGNPTVAFGGTGRMHQTYPAAAPPALRGQDDYKLVNYTYFPADGFLRDPERLGYRASPAAPRGPFAATASPPYTYSDVNSMFLAAVRADGTVLAPSFHRPGLFGPLDPSNPNWTSPEGKYLLLRPRPAEHPPVGDRPGFPFPEDATGDVKNLLGPGGNDSLWLDLGFPVLTARDGRKFKPLFAPLILDLDGKVNLNVHGNVRGAQLAHASNQGWGPWEVNLGRVLVAGGSEWQNLFVGASWPGTAALGRYGPDRLPSPGPPNRAPFGPTPPFYARVDFDSCRADGTPTGRLTLPTGTNCFPTFGPGYDNAAAVELLNHPAIYNVLGPPGRDAAGYDRRFAWSELEALLRHLDTGAPAATSDPFVLCPRSFADARARRMVTTVSADLNRPGLVPWTSALNPDGMTFRGEQYPRLPEKLQGGGPRTFPISASGQAPFDDFAWPGRAGDAPLTRVDLNRPLPAYPPTDPGTGRVTDRAGFQTAQAARQALARDIFLRLVKAVGAYDPTAFNANAAWAYTLPPTPGELNTLRWLAQLAVNVVDYIDSDDVITPFPWGRLGGSPAFAAQYGDQWVFGNELPRVLLNEAYAEYVNIPAEVGKGKRATRYVVHVWVELFNPLRTDAVLRDGGDARLDQVYQIVLSRPNRNLLSATDASNVLGDPDGTGATQRYDLGQVYTASSAFQPALLPACDKPGSGFYVVGPESPVDGASPWDPGPDFGTLRKPSMSYIEKVAPGQVISPPPPTVLLRRLACPGLPYQPDPGRDSAATPYNPYVTVDYMEQLPLNAANTNNGTGFANRAMPLAQRFATGRVQPYDANPVTNIPQAPRPPLAKQPQHTFFAHNRDAVFDPRPNFDWLIHLDRPVVSPMELLHVASCKPHQVTHLFKSQVHGGYQTFNHAPYWLLSEPASPLYRAFELLTTACRAGGAAAADQAPGKINLNTLWDPEVFLALCDPQPASGFDEADVRQIFAWLMASRTPGGAPGPGDRPFKSLGSANFTPAGDRYPDAGGIEDTILRGNPAHPLYDAQRRPIRLLEVVKQPLAGADIADHPYGRYQLLTKIFNQTTTRSNVFAVWLTVGFFAVNDDAARPPKLGPEIGRAEGRQVRRRMFAVVDRSQLISLFAERDGGPVTASTPVTGGGPAVIAPSRMRSPAGSPYTWAIRPGMILRVTGPGPDGAMRSEDVTVRAADAVTFTATFTGSYPRGFTSVTAYGNPGPRAVAVSPARDTALVPYYTIIR